MVTFPDNSKEFEINEILKEVIDPELGINIVDLGLIYGIKLQEKMIFVDMTLSAPGCPLGDVITNNVREVLSREYPDTDNHVELVWQPTWTPSMVSDAGKEALNLM